MRFFIIMFAFCSFCLAQEKVCSVCKGEGRVLKVEQIQKHKDCTNCSATGFLPCKVCKQKGYTKKTFKGSRRYLGLFGPRRKRTIRLACGTCLGAKKISCPQCYQGQVYENVNVKNTVPCIAKGCKGSRKELEVLKAMNKMIGILNEIIKKTEQEHKTMVLAEKTLEKLSISAKINASRGIERWNLYVETVTRELLVNALGATTVENLRQIAHLVSYGETPEDHIPEDIRKFNLEIEALRKEGKKQMIIAKHFEFAKKLEFQKRYNEACAAYEYIITELDRNNSKAMKEHQRLYKKTKQSKTG